MFTCLEFFWLIYVFTFFQNKKEKQYIDANQKLATFKAQIFGISKNFTEDDATD